MTNGAKTGNRRNQKTRSLQLVATRRRIISASGMIPRGKEGSLIHYLAHEPRRQPQPVG